MSKTLTALIILLLGVGCSGKRTVVSKKDYQIFKLIWGQPIDESQISIKSVHFTPGGMGAPGLLIYKAKAESGFISPLLDHQKAIPFEHGPYKPRLPQESLLEDKETYRFDKAYKINGTLLVKEVGHSEDAVTYIIIDDTSSPSLTLHIINDPRYAIAEPN